MLVDELLVVGNEGLGDGLTDGVDLRGVTTAGDADADVQVGELVEADNEEGLVDLGLLVCVVEEKSRHRIVASNRGNVVP